MIVYNSIDEVDQLVVYASKLLNHAKKKYLTIKQEVLAMMYVIKKITITY